MSDDLVQRLRAASDAHIAHGDRVDTDLLDDAAARIEALEAETAALREQIDELTEDDYGDPTEFVACEPGGTSTPDAPEEK